MAQEEIKYSILEELSQCSGYDIALMSTFNFEISFFERAILNRLLANDVKKISVFVDAGELTKALQEVDTSHIGRKYMVNPVKINASYHPKVILLLGEKKARLFVGSANIKTSGYAINNEIFNFIDYSSEHPEYLDLIVDAIDFFQEMNAVSYQLDNKILKEAKEFIYYHKAVKNEKLFLLQNMQQSILSQVQKIIGEDVKSIRIAVPYYDKELAAYSTLKSIYHNADIHLYVQNERSTFPAEYNDKNIIADHIDTFDGFKDSSSGINSNFYHGKVFLFKTEEKSYILYGSTNCTQAALIKSYAEGGNVECDFLEVGSDSDFDYFFNNMNLQKGTKLVSSPMVYEASESAKYTFKYGEVKDGIELHFLVRDKKTSVEVYIDSEKLEYKIIKEELLVYVPEDFSINLSDIFEVTFIFDGKKEVCRCWTFSVAVLDSNRVKQSDKKFPDDFDMDSNGDKYIMDRCNLLKAELTCLPELQEHKKKLAYYNQIKQEQEGDDSETVDFIVDIQIPDEYRMAYKQYHAVSKIRSLFMSRFLQTNSGGFLSKEIDIRHNGHEGDKNLQTVIKPRKATSAEKSFERFVKSKVKGMMNDTYVEIIEPRHYLGLVLVVLDIFHKYNSVDKVEDIFETEYVMKAKADFFIKLLSKDLEGREKDKIEHALLKQCYMVLIENYHMRKDESDAEKRRNSDSINRGLLMAMEKKYSIRAVYGEQLYNFVRDDDFPLAISEISAFQKYIETLFGYKNYEMLIDFIDAVYENAVVEVKGKTMMITATSTDILKHSNPKLNVLHEIWNYSKCVAKIDHVRIIINSVVANSRGKHAVAQIEHSINLEYHNWRATLIHKDGSVWNEKPTYLSY